MKEDYIFLTRPGMYYAFRAFDKLDATFYMSMYKEDNVRGFVHMKNNMNMKRRYPIKNILE